MNRNTEQHFTVMPKMHMKRSKFDRSHSLKTTWVNGDVVPIFVDADIMPGDTVTMDVAQVVRMATPIYPVMDNLFEDIMFFFVPHRLVWDHWVNFWGENDDPWTQTTNYEIPQLDAPSGGWAECTLADYMGIPTYVGNISVNALPFRAYAKIWNDWFRDENLQYNTHIYHDDTTRTGVNTGTYTTDIEKGGLPAKAAKLHDYYTSCTPSAQKGPAITIPLGTTAPVHTEPRNIPTYAGSGPLYWRDSVSRTFPANSQYNIEAWNVMSGQQDTANTAAMQKTNLDPVADLTLQPANLWTDLTQATAATINQLRTAFAIQKYYENATNGTRYIEVLRNVWGVESSDARLQRSEYLGGVRIPINMDTVLQTSSTDTTSPQGNTGAFSCTISNNSLFTKSFEEHGTLIGVIVCRTEHTYQQGLSRMWTRKKWTDIYNPFFANLGNMDVKEQEIYVTGTSTDTTAFGYQEAWADYRYFNNRVSGHMRSNSPSGSLDAWHYADDYNAAPSLSASWITEPKDNVDRTIAVQSQLANQFIGDFYFKCSYVRPMPIYSIPGLIDHV